MSIILILSSVLLVIGIFLTIYGENGQFISNLQEVGGSLIFVSVFFGFGVFGLFIPVSEDSTPVKEYSIIHTQYRVFVNTPDHYKVLEEMKYQGLEKEDINLYLVKEKNSYGLDWYGLKLEIEFKE